MPEFLRCAIEPITVPLHQLFVWAWTTGKLLAEWKEGIVILLCKWGTAPALNVVTIGQLTLPSVLGKVITHVLLTWLQPCLVKLHLPEQLGFTARQSTVDAIFALHLLSEIHREFNWPLTVAYIDLKATQ